ncbi:MAG: DUF2939 domain-containing protein [Lamprobacter sp.]|uniref:DUF2939 domain-containing protein n=1 Tax=Lamprobacter sp. TaxID=3100796 RepID=UPI002B262B2D|nr:DUF2939 domain-containing protein [Lamprobacter sp.]MEA3638759.1 DUF2939 domain-containing protein [Lamprobacter sp.]
MSAAGPLPIPKAMPQPRRLRIPPPLRGLLLGLGIALSLYLVSPYFTLWRLNLTSVNGPTSALSALVDLDAVRHQIQWRLNKDHHSTIGEVSDDFIEWIQHSLKSNGSEALTGAVTLPWLRQLLLSHAIDRKGFWPALSYACFVSPTRFRVQIGHPPESPGPAQATQPVPLHLQLGRTWLSWRVIAVYY